MPIGGPYQYRVTARRLITPTVLGLQLTPRDREGMRHMPGQYAALAFTRNEKVSQARPFSIANAPDRRGVLEFGIRLEGPFTNTFAEAKVGDEIFVYGPFGNFIWQPRLHQSVVFLAGGIGVTPFLSSLNYAAEAGLTNDLTLLYANRTLSDTPYLDHLADLAARNPHFHYDAFFSQDQTTTPPYHAGRIDALALQTAVGASLQTSYFFLCGPESFMSGMIAALTSLGVPTDRILNEAFSRGPSRELHQSNLVANVVYALTAATVISVASWLAWQTNVKASVQTSNQTPSAIPASIIDVSPVPQVVTPQANTPAKTATPTYVTPQTPHTAVS